MKKLLWINVQYSNGEVYSIRLEVAKELPWKYITKNGEALKREVWGSSTEKKMGEDISNLVIKQKIRELKSNIKRQQEKVNKLKNLL